MMRNLHSLKTAIMNAVFIVMVFANINAVKAQTDVLYKEDFENYTSEGAFGDASTVNGWLQNSVATNNTIRNLWCSYSGANYCPSCTYPTAAVRVITGERSAQVCYINASNVIAWDGTNYGVGTYNTTATTTDRYIYHTVYSTGYQNIILTFNWKCAGEIYSGSPVDYGQVGYRIGTSGAWTKLATGGYNNSGKLCNTAQAINAATYTLPAACNNATFQIAFFWNNDNTGGSGPAFIVDDIQVTGDRTTADYCRPYHQYANCSPWNDCQYVGITNVSSGTINNTTTITNSPPAYGDYTAYSTNVNANSSYTVNARYSDNGSPVNYGRIAVWIDFNGDLDFLDVNEYIGQLQATANNQIKTFNFTVPSDAYNGSVAMRVRCAYDDEGFTSTDPCSTRDYGETEDYTLNISNIVCTSPTVTAQANAVSGTTTECSGNSISLTSNASGGSGCSGSWEYAWSDGTNYWNGSSFSSVSAVWNTSYGSITVPTATVSKTYTTYVHCSADGSCTNQSSVAVTELDMPASCTAAIGSPANGTAHHMSINWSSVSGADGYNLQYSTNGSTWNTLYTGTALTYDHNCGDNPNASYYYKVRAYKGSVYCNYTNCTQYPIYTACDVPTVPLVSNITSNTLSLALVTETPVANPAITTYSIYCLTTGDYVQVDGSLATTEIFQTKSAWGTIVVNGLTATTQYCFYAKAKNNDGDVRYSTGTSILPLEQFTTSTNFSNGSSTTTKYWSPSTCSTGALLYSATGGCTAGNIGKTGSWNNYFGCFVRTPQANCTGNASVTLNFDISNSYFSAHPNDKTRFYMWVDGAYKNASQVKVGGIDVGFTDINGLWLKNDQVRSCVNVDVIFDLTTCSNLSNILFYIEPNCGYNDSYVFSVILDNISMTGATPTSCGTTLATSPLTAGTIMESQSVCTGGDPSAFSQTPASGGVATITYQWQSTTVSGCASGWADIPSATFMTYDVPSGITQTTCYRRVATDGSTTVYSNTITVTVNAIPVANAGSDVTICPGGFSFLNSTGGSSCFWFPSTGLSNTNICNPAAGPAVTTTYTVTVSANGCSASDDVTVNVFGGHIIENDTLLCVRDSVTFNATIHTVPAYTYSWNTGGSDSYIQVMPTQTTTYTVTISDGTTTCEDSVTVTISNIQTSPITGQDTVMQNNTENYNVLQHSGSTYLWQLTGGIIQSGAGTNAISILWTTVGDQVITIIETDVYGCQDTVTLDVHVDLNTGFSETAIGGITVMPNPANDVLYIVSSGNQDALVRINMSDITGRIVYQKTGTVNSNETISLSSFREGIYLLELETDSGKHSIVRVVVCR
jgi:hypothetical protein